MTEAPTDIGVDAPARQKITLDERSAILDGVIAQRSRQGWRVLSRTQTQAQLTKGKNVSHLLHLILTVFTLGIWLLIWLAMGVLGGEKQRLVTVDEFGTVTG